MMRKRICVVTGSRAEYGQLYWLMKELDGDEEIELQIIATGTHLSPEFGLTYKKILEDGFYIQDKVEILLSSDTSVGIAKSIGLGVIGFAEALARLKPDIIVILGDRFESLAVAQAALIAKIPIAHLHGGESTYGAFDESIRHAITKMSHLHFVAAAEYADRVMQLGENPEHIYNFGGPGLDYIAKTSYLSREEFENKIQFDLGETNFLVTYHPVTLSTADPAVCIEKLLNALTYFNRSKIIFTMPNADVSGRIISKKINEFVQTNKDRAIFRDSLGQFLYLNAILHTNVVIGNSSSGLTEVPHFRKPTVNIGMRQEGRIITPSVIQCDEETDSIIKAIKRALSSDFNEKIMKIPQHKYLGNISKMIKDTIKGAQYEKLLVKKFHLCLFAKTNNKERVNG